MRPIADIMQRAGEMMRLESEKFIRFTEENLETRKAMKIDRAQRLQSCARGGLRGAAAGRSLKEMAAEELRRGQP